jgi:23S rRNA (guanosine2251-2'-O)-methyltransferase
VAGRRPVEEVFIAGREALRLLVVPARRAALERIVLHATSLRIPIVEVEGGTPTSLAGFDGHQGVAVAVPPRRYATIDEILARAIERGEPPFVLALDSLEDPQNVGTLLRSAEAAGAHGVIFPLHRQAPLTAAAVKASAGAVEHLLLCPVEDLASALTDLHVRGLRVAGAEAEAPLTVRQADLRGPLAIVVGSEGQGLGPAVRRRCDVLMRIPMRGAIDSLNASVAGSILLFEALGQRDPEGRSRRPEAALRLGPAIRSAAGDEDDRVGTETPTAVADSPGGSSDAEPLAAAGTPTDDAPITEVVASPAHDADAGVPDAGVIDEAEPPATATAGNDAASADAMGGTAEAATVEAPAPADAPARAPRRRTARAVSAEGQPGGPEAVPVAAELVVGSDEPARYAAARKRRRRTGEPAVDEPASEAEIAPSAEDVPVAPDVPSSPSAGSEAASDATDPAATEESTAVAPEEATPRRRRRGAAGSEAPSAAGDTPDAGTGTPKAAPEAPAEADVPAAPKRRTRKARAVSPEAPGSSIGDQETASDSTAADPVDDELLPGGPRVTTEG